MSISLHFTPYHRTYRAGGGVHWAELYTETVSRKYFNTHKLYGAVNHYHF